MSGFVSKHSVLREDDIHEMFIY